MIGMFVSMTTAQSWEDASTHATTMMRVRINAWTSSKLANSTVLVRSVSILMASFLLFFRIIVLPGVLVMSMHVQRQQRPQM